MRLYHGGNVAVKHPKILVPARALDFGPGFYTTSSKTQTERWARLMPLRRRAGEPTLTTYEIDDNGLDDLITLSFDSPNAEWLRFVVAHRTDTYRGRRYDLVSGPVANDRTVQVINDFMAGSIDEQTALTLLLPQKLDDQYAFLSAQAVGLLKCEEVSVLDDSAR